MDRSEWVRVPRTMTDAMREAATVGYDDVDDAWDAVIAAAPPPPAEQASGEVELLPLPLHLRRGFSGMQPGEHAVECRLYARANVERALAESRAELREAWAAVDSKAGWEWKKRAEQAEARAERLAGALREWWLSKRPASWNEASHRAYHRVNCTTKAEETLADAALEQEPQE